MRTALIVTLVLALFIATSGMALASVGPAPNSGDGISDGSGLDEPYGPSGDGSETGEAVGPAPNSGDGVSDGSGF